MGGEVWGAHWASVDKDKGKMARKLSFVFSNQAPLGELFTLWSFNVEPSYLVASKFKPVHSVGDVQMEKVRVGISFEKLALGHQLLLSSELIFHLRIHFLGEETIVAELRGGHIDILIQCLGAW